MSAEKSTNGRIKADAPLALRAAFKVLERVAPDAGATLARRLWFTLPQSRTRRSEVDLPPSARFTVDVGGRPVRGTAWGSGPVVYLVHGWGGWGEQLAPYVGPLVAAGHRVVTFDAPSHGESAPGRHGPRSSTVAEMADALLAVVAHQGAPYAMVAHSIGAMSVARVMRDYGVDAERLVFVSAAAAVAPMVPVFRATFGFGSRIEARLGPKVEQYVGIPMADLDVPEIGHRLHAQGRLPALFLAHDEIDAQTPYRGSLEIAEAWRAEPPLITRGLGHRRIIRSEQVVTAAVQFLTGVREGETSQDRMVG